MARIDPRQIDTLIDGPGTAVAPKSPPPLPSARVPADAEARAAPAAAPEPITIDEFTRIDLRVARIVNAEHVDGADKLLRLTLDVGEGRHRTVFAGIKSAYRPEELVGRLTPMVANPRPAQNEVPGAVRRHGARRVRRRPRHFFARARCGCAAGHARQMTCALR